MTLCYTKWTTRLRSLARKKPSFSELSLSLHCRANGELRGNGSSDLTLTESQLDVTYADGPCQLFSLNRSTNINHFCPAQHLILATSNPGSHPSFRRERCECNDNRRRIRVPDLLKVVVPNGREQSTLRRAQIWDRFNHRTNTYNGPFLSKKHCFPQ